MYIESTVLFHTLHFISSKSACVMSVRLRSKNSKFLEALQMADGGGNEN